MDVRSYTQSDKITVRAICQKTATLNRYKNSKELVCALYCDYYLENEPDNCFVLTDEFDNAVGYILCSKDASLYKKNIKKQLLYVKKVSKIDYINFYLEHFMTRKIKVLYPAHLHINILPSFQKKVVVNF